MWWVSVPAPEDGRVLVVGSSACLRSVRRSRVGHSVWRGTPWHAWRGAGGRAARAGGWSASAGPRAPERPRCGRWGVPGSDGRCRMTGPAGYPKGKSCRTTGTAVARGACPDGPGLSAPLPLPRGRLLTSLPYRRSVVVHRADPKARGTPRSAITPPGAPGDSPLPAQRAGSLMR